MRWILATALLFCTLTAIPSCSLPKKAESTLEAGEGFMQRLAAVAEKALTAILELVPVLKDLARALTADAEARRAATTNVGELVRSVGPYVVIGVGTLAWILWNVRKKLAARAAKAIGGGK